MMNLAIKAFKQQVEMRARAYYYIYDEMVKEVGNRKSKEIISRAIYRLGVDKSAAFSKEAKESAEELAGEIIENPVSREVFQKNILESSPEKARIEMRGCPLVNTWKEMGLSAKEIENLCDMAHQVDYGKIESLGYRLKMPERIACMQGRCILMISKK
jgi:hypothetical protein